LPASISYIYLFMKKILFLFTALLFIIPCLAQEVHKTDSLESELKNLRAEKLESGNRFPKMKDTLSANILYQLSKSYWSNNPGKAMDYAMQSVSLSEHIGYKTGMANAYNSIGIINMNKGDYFSALESYLKALKINEASADKKRLLIRTIL
jgi:tetratricopeptide (TPR) repeat protein